MYSDQEVQFWMEVWNEVEWNKEDSEELKKGTGSMECNV
jgi:hypothetical protein